MILPFTPKTPLPLSDFIVGNNQELLQIIYRLLNFDSNSEFSIYIWGDHGAGKTFLLKAMAHNARQMNKPVYYIASRQPAHAQPPPLCVPPPVDGFLLIDDVQNLPTPDQVSLFDWYNANQNPNRRLLICGSMPPTQLPLYEELITRLAGGLVFRLHTLNEKGQRQALIKRAAHYGFNLPEDIADLFLSYLTRDTPSLVAALKELDDFLLQQKKTLTQRSVLSWLRNRQNPPPPEN